MSPARGSAPARQHLHEKLGEAARELTPVVVDLGPELPRFNTFVDALVGEGDDAALVLTPIASEHLPSSSRDGVRLLCTDSKGSWGVWARGISVDTASRARIDLGATRTLSDAESADLPAGAGHVSELMVLVVPGGTDRRGSYVFPVAHVARNACSVWARDPLVPGTKLARVEIIGDTRLLRQGPAEVRGVTPWYMSDGQPSFLCDLVFTTPEVTDSEPMPYELVSDPARVRRLLDFAGMSCARGWFEAPGWGRGGARFEQVGADAAELELSGITHPDGLPGAAIRITVELFADDYEMEVRVLSRCESQAGTQAGTQARSQARSQPGSPAGGRVRIALPLILRQRRRSRRDHRIPVPALQPIQLSFRNPATGAIDTRSVTELSFFALEFEIGPHEGSFWEGLPLEAAQLCWRDRTIDLGALEITGLRHDAGRALCSAAVSEPRVAQDPEMIGLLATLGHPSVTVHDGKSFERLHELYLKARLFGPHMHRNLAPILEQTADVWQRMHGRAGDVVRTLTHGPADAPDGAVTVMRAWEHAWVLQHFVDVNPEINGATGKLQFAYLDHLIPRPDGRYLLFFIKDDNSSMNAYLTRFFASTGTPEAVTRTSVELWSHRAAPEGPGAGATPQLQADTRPALGTRALTPDDDLLIARAATRCLGQQAATALSFGVGELELPDTARCFAAAGLVRERASCMVERAGVPAFAVIEELATPGMNLTWMLNASWILPMHSTAADADGLARALQYVLDRDAQTATGERFVNLPAGLDHGPLERAGFEKEATVFLYVLNRAGLHRFYHYAATRYGELDAMAQRRARRREARQPGTDHP